MHSPAAVPPRLDVVAIFDLVVGSVWGRRWRGHLCASPSQAGRGYGLATALSALHFSRLSLCRWPRRLHAN